MKKFLVISVLVAWGASLGAVSLAAAGQHHSTAPKTLVVAMHDPGCHWFLIHGKYLKTASVTGPIRLVNQDEKTLKVASSHGTQRIAVGKSLVVKTGHYTVTMVQQAADDNHLKLTVR